MQGPVQWLFLLAAGAAAGVVGTAGGITSLVSYPALLAAGIPPLTANITNSVALLGSGIGSAARAAPDLVGHSRTLRAWLPPTVLLSLAGAVLLVATPGAVFDRIVPLLVAAGAAILLLQPRIARRRQRRGARLDGRAAGAARAGVAVYNGYFGAGSGILLITLLLLGPEPVLHRANSLKNVLLVAADLLPAVLFAALGTVAWHAVLPLGLGALVGGTVGPSVARRVPARVLRPLIALSGFALAVWLLVRS